MNVRELIECLKKEPQELDVVVWDHDEDEWMTVVQTLFEDGTSHVAMLTRPEVVHPVHKYGSCGGECDLCADQ